MAVTIRDIEKKSPADRCGIRPGDRLLSINGHGISDVLDYRFYMQEVKLTLSLEREDVIYSASLQKGEYEDLGLIFDTYLMDHQKSCRNKCIFCFIDQLPKGLRESLYFKDDDSRLSFLFGNYITLTNLREEDVDRIIRMRISPVNISVHTTNPDLRVRMMKNPGAGDSLRYMGQLAEAGIQINTQLVLCPGINDGSELERSLSELAAFYPAIQSIAAVPVGLTGYREGLYPLRAFSPAEAEGVVHTIECFGNAFLLKNGTRLAYPADEFYLKAGREIPDGDFYEEMNQLENGVGMWSLLKSDFMGALEDCVFPSESRRISLATGVAAAPLMNFLVDEIRKRCHNLCINVYSVRNLFLGESITVAGLVTGTDLIRQLRGEDLGDRLLIPETMLRREADLFLDSVSLSDVSKALGIPVTPVPIDGQTLLDAILGYCP